MSIKEFLNNRNKNIGEGVYTLTSLNGGNWGIGHYDLLKLFEILADSYKKNIRKSIGLNETMGEKFNLFLDVEDDRGLVSFDDKYIEYIIGTVWDIIFNICPNCNKEFEKVVVYIARSTAFYNHKLHIVFNGLIVNKEILIHVIRRLKFLLTSDVAYCIDNKATTGLRMIGSKKYIDGVVNLEKGWYMPTAKYSFENGMTHIESKITVENLINYSINYLGQTNVYNDETYQLLQKPMVEINTNSLFWKCEMDVGRIVESPPKDATLSFLTIDDWKKILKTIPPAIETWKWLSIGRVVKNVGLDLEFWIEVSRCTEYQNPEESCRNTWKSFEEDEDRDEKAKSIVKNLVKLADNDLVDNLMKERNSEFIKVQKQHVKEIKKYYTELGTRVINDMFNIGGTKLSDRYVSNTIFLNSQLVNMLFAPLGWGKTTAIAKHISEQQKDVRVIWISPRKTFTDSLMETIGDLGFARYDTQKGQIHSNRVVVQWESMFRIETRLYDNCILICDEFESVITQSQSTTNKINLSTNIDIFRELVGKSRKVILADAFLSTRSLEVIKCIVKPEDIQVFDYIGRNKRPLTTFQKVWNKEKKGYLTPKEQFWTKFDESYTKGDKIFLFVSSKKEGREIHNRHVNSILYSSETNSSTQNVNELWKAYQLVICTTKITVGIDCQLEFDNVFASIGANVLTRDAIQALYRIRKVKGTTYLHLDGRAKRCAIPFIRTSLYNELFSKTRGIMEIISSWNNGETRQFRGTVEGLEARMFFVHNLEIAVNTKCHEQYSMALFRHQGYNVDTPPSDDVKMIFEDDIVALKETEQVILIEDYNSIPKITKREFEKLIEMSKKTVLDSIQRAKILKWRLNHYSKFEDHPNKAEAWIEIVHNDHIIESLKTLHGLFTKSREKILEKIPENPILEDGRVVKKQVFNDFMEWYKGNSGTFSQGSEISKETISNIYARLKYLDFSKEYKFAKFNEKSGDKIKFNRVSVYLSNTFNIKIARGEQQRVRGENGKRIDISSYVVKNSGIVGNFLDIINRVEIEE